MLLLHLFTIKIKSLQFKIIIAGPAAGDFFAIPAQRDEKYCYLIIGNINLPRAQLFQFTSCAR